MKLEIKKLSKFKGVKSCNRRIIKYYNNKRIKGL